MPKCFWSRGVKCSIWAAVLMAPAGADGDEAVGLRRCLELARLRLPAPLGGVESDEVDGDVIRSWELYGAFLEHYAGESEALRRLRRLQRRERGTTPELGAVWELKAGRRRPDDGHADRAPLPAPLRCLLFFFSLPLPTTLVKL